MITIDGVDIETIPATMVGLACDNYALLTGRIDEGEFVSCDDCTGADSDVATFCQVVSIVRTEIVPTVHIED